VILNTLLAKRIQRRNHQNTTQIRAVGCALSDGSGQYDVYIAMVLKLRCLSFKLDVSPFAPFDPACVSGAREVNENENKREK